MTSQNAQKTANDKMPEKPKEVATVQINTGPKSFFEEILAKEVEKDPNAVNELAQETKEEPKKTKTVKKAKQVEKSLYE